MKFVDEAVIEVAAGHGGAGSRSFRREKFQPYGGPDGGNGGKGGSVVVIADRNKRTLLDFAMKPIWKAESGAAGSGSLKDGKKGEDLTIRVPIGTEIINSKTGELVIDLNEDGEEHVIAKGGRGGKGNDFFKSSTNRAPEHAQPGEEGEEGKFILSLKLVADLGLIGFPNAGKSTLISRVSQAKPKIADYPFTTLVPNLGVAKSPDGYSFVVADIPGLIPGAHTGKGLGTQFLKHIERTRILAHLVDLNQLDAEGNQADPVESFDLINDELKKFSQTLAEKSQFVVLTKMDALPDRSAVEKALKTFKDRGYEAIAISSVSGEQLNEFLRLCALKLQKFAEEE